jgi:hypothetical protein
MVMRFLLTGTETQKLLFEKIRVDVKLAKRPGRLVRHQYLKAEPPNGA